MVGLKVEITALVNMTRLHSAMTTQPIMPNILPVVGRKVFARNALSVNTTNGNSNAESCAVGLAEMGFAIGHGFRRLRHNSRIVMK